MMLSAERLGVLLGPGTQGWMVGCGSDDVDRVCGADAAMVLGVALSRNFVSDLAVEVCLFCHDALSEEQAKRLETAVYLRVIDLEQTEGWRVYSRGEARPGNQVLRRLTRLALEECRKCGVRLSESEQAGRIGYGSRQWGRLWRHRYGAVYGLVNGLRLEAESGFRAVQRLGETIDVFA